MDNPRVSVYKPNKRGAGAAVRFDLNVVKEAVFLEAARQIGEQKFDWENKVVIKLNATDIAKLLLVLEGKAKTTDLFHDTTKAPSKDALAQGAERTKNAAVNLSKSDFGYYLKASEQSAAGAVNAVSVPVSEDEGVLLRVLFERALVRMAGW
ncbi:hypothetical protein COT29_01715 [Candidatus Micrarchaeota archaeon CG08_land_8_20_14_0_20_59_11]|nr:MAG: hypothetical protein COT29_01715 [Candidatus Micrarchaeota archaeon CG08_land_8_20_14_0_20_59_11]PIT85069.1 MAG: hypothetical protein COU36_05380 [Candidatus Micrarchaeota archaeon CG10_big_fil_rev_8_21_14_0_10_59_7]